MKYYLKASVVPSLKAEIHHPRQLQFAQKLTSTVVPRTVCLKFKSLNFNVKGGYIMCFTCYLNVYELTFKGAMFDSFHL